MNNTVNMPSESSHSESRLKIDTPPKASVERDLEVLHLVSDPTEPLLEPRDFFVDPFRGRREHRLHLR